MITCFILLPEIFNVRILSNMCVCHNLIPYTLYLLLFALYDNHVSQHIMKYPSKHAPNLGDTINKMDKMDFMIALSCSLLSFDIYQACYNLQYIADYGPTQMWCFSLFALIVLRNRMRMISAMAWSARGKEGLMVKPAIWEIKLWFTENSLEILQNVKINQIWRKF